ncbi:MAG: 1-(5-phosphoribosyl)-5-[(5-phosphoribosylamino)methylideneamino]imidazole-4-carboxamide isomerase [Spirochaetes bacterium]|nr:MAG: 1-(5-phosphoribosyl)-5-[(5-phosphoribosylamino)methylideneamino]imidazole-4-carboxamide isomerase [Spirochaetota bacterium]
MIFIPAIDLINGRCVRLKQGRFSEKIEYPLDPVEVAKSFEDKGAGRIHVVDLDAAKSGGDGNLGVIKKIAASVRIPVEVGGGVRDESRIERLLDAGVEYIILGTIIVKDRDKTVRLINTYGQKLIAGVDASNGRVMISAWEEDGGLDILSVIKSVEMMGFNTVIYTDISRDGMLKGPDIPGIRNILDNARVNLIISGGISSIEDLIKIKQLGLPEIIGVISGKAIYEGRIDVSEACRILSG